MATERIYEVPSEWASRAWVDNPTYYPDPASIKEAYARVRNGEIFLEGMNITPYEQGNRYNHDPVRTRKLLLHRKEIERLIGVSNSRVSL